MFSSYTPKAPCFFLSLQSLDSKTEMLLMVTNATPAITVLHTHTHTHTQTHTEAVDVYNNQSVKSGSSHNTSDDIPFL